MVIESGDLVRVMRPILVSRNLVFERYRSANTLGKNCFSFFSRKQNLGSLLQLTVYIFHANASTENLLVLP